MASSVIPSAEQGLRGVVACKAFALQSPITMVRVGDTLKSYPDMQICHCYGDSLFSESGIFFDSFASVRIQKKVAEFAVQFFDDKGTGIQSYTGKYCGNDFVKLSFSNSGNFHSVNVFLQLQENGGCESSTIKIVVAYENEKITANKDIQ